MIHRRGGSGFRTFSLLGAVLVCLAFVLGGCGDDDDDNPVKPRTPSIYPVLSHPSNVLQALEIAYARRDSVEYKALHDPTYTGQSVDLNDPGNTINLTFDDEARHIAALAQAPSLSAYLDLGPPETWDRMPSDDPSHPDWAVIQIPGLNYQVEIFDGPNAIAAGGELGASLEFAFVPTLNSTSPSDTLWKIVRWKETGVGSPVP